ncbi:hypothetical protein [Micromonospora cathayae]|uniref:Uncharacterized protein n=1 Tax=Micromonospora cathayae TaxID=3028804 RepID=A0ABY7ZV47_9ACTN|nr:hypothetical protein [Micromonospora sp. HUAS 3]WDZ86276.1 hypothetical protein PVK37_07680 [Micromonospora sp. HUAS 3]
MHSQPGGGPPVFVDRTGRRRRLSIVAGTAMGLGLLTSLGLIAAGLFTGSSVPLPGWSENQLQNKPIEAGVGGTEGLGSAPTGGPSPSPATSITVPVRPEPTTAPPAASVSADPGGPQVTGTDRPGRGDERRIVKPGRSPGRPG